MPWCQSSMGISELSIYLLALGEGWEGGGGQGLRETAGLVSQKNDAPVRAMRFVRGCLDPSSGCQPSRAAHPTSTRKQPTHFCPLRRPTALPRSSQRGLLRGGRQELSALSGHWRQRFLLAHCPQSLLDRGGRSSAPDESAP